MQHVVRGAFGAGAVVAQTLAPSEHDGVVDAVLERAAGRQPEQPRKVGLVLADEPRRVAVDFEDARVMCMMLGEHGAVADAQRRTPEVGPSQSPGPVVARPELRQDVQRGRRPARGCGQ